MLDFSKLEEFDEVAILFSKKYKDNVEAIYTEITVKFPEKNVYLVPNKDILCAAKCRKYKSYVLIGIECPLHKFDNTVQFKIPLSQKALEDIRDHNGPIVTDSIHTDMNISDLISSNHNGEVLVVTDSQQVLNYYTSMYERVKCYSPEYEKSNLLECEDRVRYLMKENTDSRKLERKRLIGVIFTSKCFEPLATNLANAINRFARAYKIFLRDISYERLISIDHLDCLVLIDCPLFQCRIDLHIPVLSPFAVNCFINGTWTDEYERNRFEPSREINGVDQNQDASSTDIVFTSPAGEILESRWYKGAPFQGSDEDDMEIYQGRKGIALGYEKEGKCTQP